MKHAYSLCCIASLVVGGGFSAAADEVTIITQPALTAQVGQLYQYDVDAVSNSPSASIIFELRERPLGMTIDSESGLVQWTPAQAGAFRVKIRAQGESSGGGSGHDDQEYMLRVLNGSPSILRGVVRNQAGEGVGSVRLRLFEITSGHFLFNTESDSSGGYMIPDVNPGSYFIRVRPPDNNVYAPQWYDRVLRIENATPVVIPESTIVTTNITLLPRDSAEALFSLSGTVTDTNGVPITRARVFIFRARHDNDLDGSGHNFEGLDDNDRDRRLVRVVTTDSQGNYSTRLRPRRYILAAHKEGFQRQFWDHKTNPLDADRLHLVQDTSGIDFDLIPEPSSSGAITGLITARTTGHPVASHVLGFHKPSPGGGFSGFVRVTRADSVGHYRLEQLRNGFYVVLALPESDFLPTFYDTSGGTTRIDEAFPVQVMNSMVNGIDIRVSPDTVSGMNRVKGTVMSGGAPVSGTILYAVPASGNDPAGAAVSDASGSYRLVGLAPGSYILHAAKPGFEASASAPFVLHYAGNMPSTAVVNMNLQSTISGSEPVAHLPVQLIVHQNYPNPFNPSTSISFELSRAIHTRLTVYNLLGQTVATLVHQDLPAGVHTVVWEASGVSSGVYFYRLEVNGMRAVRRMLLVR